MDSQIGASQDLSEGRKKENGGWNRGDVAGGTNHPAEPYPSHMQTCSGGKVSRRLIFGGSGLEHSGTGGP